MEILVYNCLHWIGFHYVNYLLEQGMVVRGVDTIDSNKKENLSLFFGRNSSFRMANPRNRFHGEKIIIIGDEEIPEQITAKKILKICDEPVQHVEENMIVVKPPILFGEWMTMTEEGVFLNERLISFDSEEFRSQAVYIKDFIEETLPLLDHTPHSTTVRVFPKKIFLNDQVKLENSLYIRDNIPVGKQVRKLKEHYQRFKDLY